jgi:1-aminocyclopropane-1-carboxylate synthase
VEEEEKLAWKMINGGVWVATGEAYSSEEPGWFRITFAVPEEELMFGMERLKAVLR